MSLPESISTVAAPLVVEIGADGFTVEIVRGPDRVVMTRAEFAKVQAIGLVDAVLLARMTQSPRTIAIV